jgi:hypothetical protein
LKRWQRQMPWGKNMQQRLGQREGLPDNSVKGLHSVATRSPEKPDIPQS